MGMLKSILIRRIDLLLYSDTERFIKIKIHRITMEKQKFKNTERRELWT